MKYIRTKDGKIYNINDLHISEDLVGKPYVTNKGSWCIYRESIIKQADTIEELCDEYVAIKENENPYLFSIYEIGNKKYVYINEESGEPLLETFIKNKIIYGAIWTDKGLIYVAKMNESGVLELL